MSRAASGHGAAALLLAASLSAAPLTAQQRADDPSPHSDAQLVSELAAIGEATAGQAVSVATTQPYGCSVKYKN